MPSSISLTNSAILSTNIDDMISCTVNDIFHSTAPVVATQAQVDALQKSIDLINLRLSILIPDPEKLEKHAALKNTYDEYLILEALLTS